MGSIGSRMDDLASMAASSSRGATRVPPLDLSALRRSSDNLKALTPRRSMDDMRSALEAMRAQRTHNGISPRPMSPLPPRPPLHSPRTPRVTTVRPASAPANNGGSPMVRSISEPLLRHASPPKPPPAPNLKTAAANVLRSPRTHPRPLSATAASPQTKPPTPRGSWTPRKPPTGRGSVTPRKSPSFTPRRSVTPRKSPSFTPRGSVTPRKSPRLSFTNSPDGKTVAAVKPRLTVAKLNSNNAAAAAEKTAKSAAFKAAQLEKKAKIAKLAEPSIRKLEGEVQSLIRSEKYFDAYKRLNWDTERAKFLEATRATFAKNPDKTFIAREVQEQMNGLKKKFADLELRNHAAINKRDTSKYWIDTHFRDSTAEKLKAVKTFMKEYRGGKDIAIITGGQKFKADLAKNFPSVKMMQLGTRDAFQVVNRNDFLRALGMA